MNMSVPSICIVEDERIVAEDIRRSLIHLDYEVAGIANTGADAFRLVSETKPDIVLMDIVLKGEMDGIETANRILKEFNIPVIYLSAYTDEITLERAKITEPFGYLVKPFEIKELQSSIKIALYKHSMQKHLKESEKWFHTTLTNIADGVITTDKMGHVIYMNPPAEKLTGWILTQAVGKPVQKIVRILNQEDMKEQPLRIHQIIQNQKQSRLFSNRILISRQQKQTNINCRATTISDEAGEPIGSVMVFYDITEQIQAQKVLKESEQEKALILTSVSEMVTYQDREYRIKWVNRAAEKMFRIKTADLSGEKCHELWQSMQVSCEKCPFQDVIEKDITKEIEMESAQGRVWLVRGYPVHDDQGKVIGLVEVSREITKEKQMQAEKKAVQDQLHQIQKMEAIGTLTGGVAHDFNNLLTSIQGSADMAMLRVLESDPVYRDLREIQSAASKAANLTRQLLLFSRKHPTQLVPINLNQIIHELLKMLERLIGEDIHISTSLASDLWTVRVDQGNMEQVIMNLVVNGRDAMPQGGKILIKTENVTLQEGIDHLMPESRPGKFVSMSVSDTGSGIASEIIDQIFEPFFSTKGPAKGTGLGLSVVYGIMKHHEGWIHVHSEKGKGSTFIIYLPAVSEQAEEIFNPKISVAGIQGKGEHILVIEDAEGVREFAVLALSENGYHVMAVDNVKEALALLQDTERKVDLVFTDVVLPDQSGIELIDQIHDRFTNLRIVLTSGYTDNKSQWPIIQEKGYFFLQKPYSLVQLLQCMKNAFSL